MISFFVSLVEKRDVERVVVVRIYRKSLIFRKYLIY